MLVSVHLQKSPFLNKDFEDSQPLKYIYNSHLYFTANSLHMSCVDGADICTFQITAESFLPDKYFDFGISCDVLSYLFPQASPILMEEKEVYVEAKRANSRGRQSS